MGTRRVFTLLLSTVVLLNWANAGEKKGSVLTGTKLKTYVEQFNVADEELFAYLKTTEDPRFTDRPVKFEQYPYR